jgi:hypothetical protein
MKHLLMRFFICFLILGITFLLGCTGKDRMASPATKTIEVPDEAEVVDKSNFFSHVEYVVLETTSGSEIASIDKLLMSDDKIFVLDGKTHSIISFSTEGKFIGTFNNVGRGPNEYRTINDFDILPGGEGLVILADDSQLFLLSSDLEINKVVPIPITKAFGLAAIDPDHYLLFTDYWPRIYIDKSETEYYLLLLELSTGKMSGVLPKQLDDDAFMYRRGLLRSDFIVFNEYMEDKAYIVSGEGVEEVWQFNFPDNPNNPETDGYALTTKRTVGSLSFYKKGNLILLSFSIPDYNLGVARNYTRVFDTDSEAFYSLKNDLSMVPIYNYLGTFSDGFIAQLPPVPTIKRLYNYQELPALFHDLAVLDNPVIALYYVRK